MIEINNDGEVVINGQNISELTKSKTSSVKRTVLIKNGQVIKDDIENVENIDGNEDFHNEFMDKMSFNFPHLQKVTTIKCSYCGSAYKSSQTECPNCGANNSSI